jgi:hypothetical protein
MIQPLGPPHQLHNAVPAGGIAETTLHVIQ